MISSRRSCSNSRRSAGVSGPGDLESGWLGVVVAVHRCGEVIGYVIGIGLPQVGDGLVGIRVVFELLPDEAEAVLALADDLAPGPKPDPHARLGVKEQARRIGPHTTLGEVGKLGCDQHEIPSDRLSVEASVVDDGPRVVLDLVHLRTTDWSAA